LKSFSAGLLRVNVAVAALQAAGGSSIGAGAREASARASSSPSEGTAAISGSGFGSNNTFPAPIRSRIRASRDVLPRDGLDTDPLVFPAEDGGFGIPDVHSTMRTAAATGSEVAVHAMQDAGVLPPTEGVPGARHLQREVLAAVGSQKRGSGDAAVGTALPSMPQRP